MVSASIWEVSCCFELSKSSTVRIIGSLTVEDDPDVHVAFQVVADHCLHRQGGIVLKAEALGVLVQGLILVAVSEDGDVAQPPTNQIL